MRTDELDLALRTPAFASANRIDCFETTALGIRSGNMRPIRTLAWPNK